MKANIKKLAYLMIGLFLILIVYLTYIQLYKGEDWAANPKNRRTQKIEAEIVRGAIFDRNGDALAKTDVNLKEKKRIYPQGALTGTITGYNSLVYGKTGLEETYNKYLLGITKDREWANFKNRMLGKPQFGDDLYLTIDMKLQALSQQLLGNRKGAVVALNPKTGDILALYSNPGFDPNQIDVIWKNISNKGEESPLINRATQGLYPPGSTMKMVTGSLALKNNPNLINSTFDASGSIKINGFTLNDHGSYGQINFYKALEVSSNVVFAKLGLDLGNDKFYQGARDFGFNRTIPFDIPVNSSTLEKPGQMSKTELGTSAIGQGKVLATPLQMAMVASAIANDGNIMAPRLVTTIKDHDGKSIKNITPNILFTPISSNVAKIMKEAMVGVVDNGTGTSAQIPGIKVAGKTGTAENPHGASHAWFVGFAPADNPQIVIAVLVENVGYGGTEAAPIARSIIETALK